MKSSTHGPSAESFPNCRDAVISSDTITTWRISVGKWFVTNGYSLGAVRCSRCDRAVSKSGLESTGPGRFPLHPPSAKFRGEGFSGHVPSRNVRRACCQPDLHDTCYQSWFTRKDATAVIVLLTVACLPVVFFFRRPMVVQGGYQGTSNIVANGPYSRGHMLRLGSVTP